MPLAPIDATTTVEYLVTGEAAADATDVVLIHGTGGTAESHWMHLIDGLTGGHSRAIIPNFAGSGATVDHGGQLEVSDLVAQVDGAAQHAGSAQYDVVGFSLGAVVAAQLAADRPERIRRMVLIAGWGSSDDARVHLQFETWRRLYATDRESLANMLTLTGFSPQFLAKRPSGVVRRMVRDTLTTLPDGFARQCELDQRIDLSQTLPRVKASTLVIGCREDQMVPVEHARGLVAPIRWSDYFELNCGHLAIYERPTELTDAIRGFLRKPERRATVRPEPT